MSKSLRSISDKYAFSTPKHIAITMDGNGRWGKGMGFSRSKGHYEGARTMEKIIDACIDLNVDILTLYAFSSENWARPKDEVNYLMYLPIRFFKQKLPIFMEKNIKVLVAGDLSGVPKRTRDVMEQAIEETKNNSGIIVNFAFNYGGRDEILQATQEIIKAVQCDEFDINDLNEQLFTNYLYTGDLPDPELFIRTGGEKRMSNFLLWQAASAELYFTDVYFPDFSKQHLIEAINHYNDRYNQFFKPNHKSVL